MRVGSEHAPIVLDTWEGNAAKRAHFHFEKEKQWLLMPSFKEVFNNIAETFQSHKYNGALDMWKVVMTQLRKFLRIWS
jgi:hypothetical protein